MKPLYLPLAVCLFLGTGSGQLSAAETTPIPTALGQYVSQPDTAFQWERKGQTQTPAGTIHELRMTSQVWHGEKWEHALQVFVPTNTKPDSTILLYNTGGNPGVTSTFLGMIIAQKAKMPVAFLYNVPKQPLFGGKKEDALIAETFVRFLESEDATWPLLFPMVKSVVRGMDTIQQFVAEEFQTDVRKFVITGASKRGWTSWLTAATGDKRVIAIAPMVIDTLNIPTQLKNQVRAFGKPSEMIRDYTVRNLIPLPPGKVSQALWRMVDPWSYRAKLSLPKMIINGANDPYWPLDALNSYWDDLPGEKYVLYVPNAGHNLEERRANGFKDRERALGTLAAFTHHQVTGTPMPKLRWKHEGANHEAALTLTSDVPMKVVRLWKASADTRDFRKSVWTEQTVGTSSQQAQMKLSPPTSGFAAYFGEAEYEQNGLTFYLSTQLRILEAGQ